MDSVPEESFQIAPAVDDAEDVHVTIKIKSIHDHILAGQKAAGSCSEVRRSVATQVRIAREKKNTAEQFAEKVSRESLLLHEGVG